MNRYHRRKGSACNPRPWILKCGVDMITHWPHDPMCCPTQRVVKTYALEGDQLVETGSRTIASSSDGGLKIVGTVWQWTKFLEANDNEILVDDPENYTIEFMPDGAVQIKADCKSVGSSYTVAACSLLRQSRTGLTEAGSRRCLPPGCFRSRSRY